MLKSRKLKWTGLWGSGMKFIKKKKKWWELLCCNNFPTNILTKDLAICWPVEVFVDCFLLTFQSYAKIHRELILCNTATSTFRKHSCHALLRWYFSKAHSALIYQCSHKILKLHLHRPQLACIQIFLLSVHGLETYLELGEFRESKLGIISIRNNVRWC